MSDHDDDPPHERPVDPFPTGFGPRPPSMFPPVFEPADPGPEPVSAPDLTPVDPPSDWNARADAHDLPTLEPRLAALGRFAFPPGEPLDDEGLSARDRRWTSRAIVFATLMLLVFNAESPRNWARQQPPGWATATVQGLSDVWAAQISQTGADQPGQRIGEAWRAFQNLRFSSSDAVSGDPEA